MAGSLKIRLAYICLLTFFNFSANVTVFVLYFRKIYSLNLIPMWLKELLLHQGSIKMDKYSGMFWALNHSNGRSGCYAWSGIITIGMCNDPSQPCATLRWRIVTMKLWHWKSHWKPRVTLKNLGTKEMSNAENFSVWFQCPWTTKENISVR